MFFLIPLYIYALYSVCVVVVPSTLRSLSPVLSAVRVLLWALTWLWRRSLSLRTECSLVFYSSLLVIFLAFWVGGVCAVFSSLQREMEGKAAKKFLFFGDFSAVACFVEFFFFFLPLVVLALWGFAMFCFSREKNTYIRNGGKGAKSFCFLVICLW